ncbi:4-(cytidine 5'-diphospho)-2-C-methyl-D-erythritol kinase [Oharaeibacter diazotrophicus]|uniref:4-diphosphocytidyl-2-C-methyl-D-erythritol kinase n=1 Tax=Oharaeibacter diazotrophicus TaxID=1920512 RepID=A0A4R6RKW8_9HYPH|nr:4-(cytidine 5'-diphospho)-2-C-methyl-D-erythritol kinase [Oharaeibacter diazotrophicus]TDP87122.1 4-diphosphocytidyl-2-C-methyl-D-erythritol kinase [Oharaeibacter diazotrophicus]BBE70935.1 4-diphosphocytidyl-2-C-methyl-D-erythritolkinase [Pleomorphomonas sp. SM30]GLS77684.1 4-diphosphocytidyl-2-C-methyl-D-erythritol kinase [Oharaeibacter diazotrophicus]
MSDVAAPRVVEEEARAKVNLALHVVGRRADGYHLLDTLVAFPAVGDRLIAAPADGLTLTVDGPRAGALGDCAPEDNLVLRAARALARSIGIAAPGACLRLDKRLPVASGIGGGSADAAAALRALSRLWGVASEAELARLAEGLGADVPMCVASRPARARGVGERLDPLPALPPLGIVLVNPGVAVATPAVFRALAVKDNPPLPDPPGRFDAAGLLAYLAATRNDLEAPAVALAPVIAAVLAVLRTDDRCLFARMSGSGATCFALAESETAAAEVAAAVSAVHRDWWVASAAL